MRSTTTHARQMLGCGYESPGKLALGVWRSPTWKANAPDDEPTTCVGYTSKLPEVIEASRAHAHWDKGDLRIATSGEVPTDALVLAVEVIASESHRTQEWLMTPAKDGGGGR